jgi:hypothetical protein
MIDEQLRRRLRHRRRSKDGGQRRDGDCVIGGSDVTLKKFYRDNAAAATGEPGDAAPVC